MGYEHIKVESAPPIATITLDRPKVLNALSPALIAEVGQALSELDANQEIRAVVLTGGPKVFAAGADIGDMAQRTAAEQLTRDMTGAWSPIANFTKPLVAAVNGYALGGGCELALETVLAGTPITATRAHQLGLVNKVVPAEMTIAIAQRIARQLAEKPPLAVRLAKESVLKAFETPLAEGLASERRSFYFLFSTEDQKEGMRAFLEKRPASFTGR